MANPPNDACENNVCVQTRKDGGRGTRECRRWRPTAVHAAVPIARAIIIAVQTMGMRAMKLRISPLDSF